MCLCCSFSVRVYHQCRLCGGPSKRSLVISSPLRSPNKCAVSLYIDNPFAKLILLRYFSLYDSPRHISFVDIFPQNFTFREHPLFAVPLFSTCRRRRHKIDISRVVANACVSCVEPIHLSGVASVLLSIYSHLVRSIARNTMSKRSRLVYRVDHSHRNDDRQQYNQHNGDHHHHRIGDDRCELFVGAL